MSDLSRKMLSRQAQTSNDSRCLDKAIRDELTANESSIGSSGGTTDVRIRVHSKKSL